jgi:hypothetical protein
MPLTLLLIASVPYILLQDLVNIGTSLGQVSPKSINRHYKKILEELGEEEPKLTYIQLQVLKARQLVQSKAPFARVVQVEVAMATLKSIGLDPKCLEVLLNGQYIAQQQGDTNLTARLPSPSNHTPPQPSNKSRNPSHTFATTLPQPPQGTPLPRQAPKDRYGLSMIQPKEVREKMERELKQETSKMKAWSSNPIQMDRPVDVGCVSTATWDKEVKNIKSFVGFAYFKFNVNVATLLTYFNTHLFMAFISFLMARGVQTPTMTSHILTAIRACYFWTSTHNDILGVDNPESVIQWLQNLK